MMRLFCLLSVCYLWFCGFGGKQEGKVSDSALYVLKDKAYGHISKGEYQETERVCQEILQNTVCPVKRLFFYNNLGKLLSKNRNSRSEAVSASSREFLFLPILKQ